MNVLAKFYGGSKDGLEMVIFKTQERIVFRDGCEYIRHGAERYPDKEEVMKLRAYIYRPVEEMGRYYK